MKAEDIGASVVALLSVLVAFAVVCGWIMNIITILSSPEVYDTAAQLVFGIIGAVIPFIGAITYFVAG